MRYIFIIIISMSFVLCNFNKVENCLIQFQKKYYNNTTKLWNCQEGCDWWQSARALDVINDFILLSSWYNVDNNFTKKLGIVTQNIYDHYSMTFYCKQCSNHSSKVPCFVQCSDNCVYNSDYNIGCDDGNGYYDDEGWWGLAFIRAYETMKNKNVFILKYLNLSKNIQKHMNFGWTNTCNGGIPWRHCGTYKGAIQNELYFLLTIKLYQHTRNIIYLDQAEKIFIWFINSGLINKNYSINGGLTNNCYNDNTPGYTYNQGVILPALLLFYKYTNNIYSKNLSSQIVRTILNKKSGYLWNDIVLREKDCVFKDNCDKNQRMFKGIFMQYLKDWFFLGEFDIDIDIDIDDYNIIKFYKINSINIWSITNECDFPLIWTQKINYDNPVDFRTTLSAITTLISYLLMRKKI